MDFQKRSHCRTQIYAVLLVYTNLQIIVMVDLLHSANLAKSLKDGTKMRKKETREQAREQTSRLWLKLPM